MPKMNIYSEICQELGTSSTSSYAELAESARFLQKFFWFLAIWNVEKTNKKFLDMRTQLELTGTKQFQSQ